LTPLEALSLSLSQRLAHGGSLEISVQQRPNPNPGSFLFITSPAGSRASRNFPTGFLFYFLGKIVIRSDSSQPLQVSHCREREKERQIERAGVDPASIGIQQHPRAFVLFPDQTRQTPVRVGLSNLNTTSVSHKILNPLVLFSLRLSLSFPLLSVFDRFWIFSFRSWNQRQNHVELYLFFNAHLTNRCQSPSLKAILPIEAPGKENCPNCQVEAGAC